MRLALNRGDTTIALITEDFEITGSLPTSVEERVNDAISYAERDQTVPGRNSDSEGVTPGEEYTRPTKKQQMIDLHFAVEKFTSLNPVRRGTWGDSFEKEWIPYEGPQGGEGWQNTEDPDDVRYNLEEPPGEVAEGYEEVAEDWGEDPSQPEHEEIENTLENVDFSDYSVMGGDCVSIAVAIQNVFGGEFVASYANDVDFRQRKPAHVAVEIDGEMYDGGGNTNEELLEERAFYGRPEQWDDIIVSEVDAPSPQLHTPEDVEDITERIRQQKEDLDKSTLSKDEWIPYEGPLGGEGWQSTEDQTDVRYTDDPPGEVAEGYEEVAEDWGEDPSQPELDDFGFRGPASSATEDFESVSSHIEPVFEDGEIDGGVVEADIRPQDSERWDSVWDLDGENPKVEHPAKYGNLFADVQMPVGDFKKIQAHIGNNLNTWDGTFFEEVDEQRLQSVTEGLTGEDVDTEFYDGVPVPYIEIGSDGTLKSTQEGRHRVVAAERLGLDEIPVRVIIDPDEPGEGYNESAIDNLETDYMDMAERVEDADNETKVEATTEMENKLQENISSETEISLPGYRIRAPVKVKPTAEVAETIERADEIGITEGLEAVDTLFPHEEAIGQYNYDTDTLSLRHNTRPGELQSAYEDGYIVGDSYEYTVLHELGHHAHSERIDDRSNDVYKKDVPDSILHIPNEEEGGFRYGMDLQDKIENELSTYAAENTPEFVAEMFAGLCLGVEFNEEMMKYYERVGGPEEWREYRKAAGYGEDPAVGKQDGEDLPEQFAISAQRTLRSFRNWKQD